MLAVLLSLGAAITFALSAMFISATGGRVQVFQLARWQMGLAFPVLAAVSLLDGGWAGVTARQFGLLAASSAVGIMLASSTFLATIGLAGPRISAVLFSLASPFAVGLGWVTLGEALTAPQLAGIALILLGIVLAVLAERGGSLGAAAGRRLWLGIGLGVVTSLGQAAGSLLARPAMASGVEPVTAMAIRSGLGFLFFLALLALPGARAPGRPLRADVLNILWGALTGMVVGMSLLMAALSVGDVGIVSTLSSTTPILILPMVWAVSRKAPPPLAWAGAALAVAGTALISLAG
jgi:drug/metabolite transporter (DMT)-like permease